MELKDVILSTLAEMENEETLTTNESSPQQPAPQEPQSHSQDVTQQPTHKPAENELVFLNAIRERLLVLFEGFQAPNNANLEAKIDMTLNFLEYTLATIDERIEHIQKDTLL